MQGVQFFLVEFSVLKGHVLVHRQLLLGIAFIVRDAG